MAKTETVTFKANTSHFKRGIKGMTERAKGFASTMGKIGAIAVPLAGVAGGFIAIRKAMEAIDKGATFETLELQLANILKSSGQAKDVFGEIKKFSGSTPFQIADITKGVTALTVANKELGINEKLWAEVGNTASKGGRTFEEVAKQVSKFISATQSEAKAIATPLESLSSDMQVLSGKDKDDLLGLKKAGANAEELQAKLRSIMQDNEGNMKRQSSSWNGLKSTMADTYDLMMGAFGTGIIDQLKPILVDITDKLKSWIPIAKQWGEKVASVAKSVYIAMSGNSGNGIKLFVLGLKIAGKTFVNFLYKGLMFVADKFGEAIENVGKKGAIKAFNMSASFLEFGGVILPRFKEDPIPKEFENKSLLDSSGDQKEFNSLLDGFKVKMFETQNENIREDMTYKTHGFTKGFSPENDFKELMGGVVNGVSKLDFKEIATTLKNKTSSMFEGAKEYWVNAKNKLDVKNFTGTSNQLRPVSDLSSHGGGGVYGMTGTQRHEMQMLNSTKNIERSLMNIERNQNSNTGGALFN